MPSGQKALIFYSSMTEPEIPRLYAESISYLHASGIKLQIIDVDKRPDLAEKYEIIATPVVIVKKGRTEHTYFGILDGLKRMLMEDLQGRSTLHIVTLREGRQAGRKLKFRNKKELEKKLEKIFGERGISKFVIARFDKQRKYAKVRVRLEGAEQPQAFEIAAFLRGIFTEVFDKGTPFKELKSTKNYKEFETV